MYSEGLLIKTPVVSLYKIPPIWEQATFTTITIFTKSTIKSIILNSCQKATNIVFELSETWTIWIDYFQADLSKSLAVSQPAIAVLSQQFLTRGLVTVLNQKFSDNSFKVEIRKTLLFTWFEFDVEI